MSLNFSNCLIISKTLEPLWTCIDNGNFSCLTGCLLGHVWIYPPLHFTPSALFISPTTCPYSNFILSSIFVTAHYNQRVLATCHACVTILWNIGCILLCSCMQSSNHQEIQKRRLMTKNNFLTPCHSHDTHFSNVWYLSLITVEHY